MTEYICKVCEISIQAESRPVDDVCDICSGRQKAKKEKEARYEVYCETYEPQLRLQRYIKSLERDLEELNDALKTATRGIRRIKKLIKINERDKNLYEKQLKALPPVPPFS